MPTFRFFCVICGVDLSGKAGARGSVTECPACRHQVPVPTALNMQAGSAEWPHILPPGILALEVKFPCKSCGSPLRADARWEGRNIFCPVCTDIIQVPAWSQPPGTPTDTRRTKADERLATATLSTEEIAFLSEATPVSPGAAG